MVYAQKHGITMVNTPKHGISKVSHPKNMVLPRYCIQITSFTTVHVGKMVLPQKGKDGLAIETYIKVL